MAAAETVPEVPRPVAPASSDTPASGDTPSSNGVPADKPLTKRSRITVATMLAFAIAIVANVALITMLTNRGEPAPTVSTQAQQQPSPVAAVPPAAPPNLPTTVEEGTFVVGTDIAPGTYHTDGSDDTQYCYWERFKDPTGAPESIIANHVGRGPATVTIDAGDGTFNTRFCGTWTKID